MVIFDDDPKFPLVVDVAESMFFVDVIGRGIGGAGTMQPMGFPLHAEAGFVQIQDRLGLEVGFDSRFIRFQRLGQGRLGIKQGPFVEGMAP